MNGNNNTEKFVRKITENFGFSEEQVYQLLSLDIHGSPVYKIDNNTKTITEINIRGLAHAKSEILKKSGIRERAKMFDITEIDISDLQDLVKLDFCSRTNNEAHIKSYEFNALSNLESLIFKFHKVKRIDISNCNELRYLNCSMNQLESLDVVNNKKMTHLDCQMNPIASLDLSNHAALTYLLANSTNLSQENIHFHENNNITELHLRGTKIDNFDPSRLSKLSVLRISNLIQSSFDTIQNPKLYKLQLANCKIESVDISLSKNLLEFSCTGTQTKEIICNEFQAYAVPFLAKSFKLIPNEKQSNVIKTIELHNLAKHHNWDEGTTKLNKILKSPHCDLATATMIYWIANPNYYLKYAKVNEAEEYEKLIFRFINKLEKRILKGEFETNIIDFDPTNLFSRKISDNNANNIKRKIPKELFRKIEGNKINEFDYTRTYKTKI